MTQKTLTAQDLIDRIRPGLTVGDVPTAVEISLIAKLLGRSVHITRGCINGANAEAPKRTYVRLKSDRLSLAIGQRLLFRQATFEELGEGARTHQELIRLLVVLAAPLLARAAIIQQAKQGGWWLLNDMQRHRAARPVKTKAVAMRDLLRLVCDADMSARQLVEEITGPIFSAGDQPHDKWWLYQRPANGAAVSRLLWRLIDRKVDRGTSDGVESAFAFNAFELAQPRTREALLQPRNVVAGEPYADEDVGEHLSDEVEITDNAPAKAGA